LAKPRRILRHFQPITSLRFVFDAACGQSPRPTFEDRRIWPQFPGLFQTVLPYRLFNQIRTPANLC
jgi:hypothetical protein